MRPSESMGSGLQSLLDKPAAQPMCRASPLQTRLGSPRLVAVVPRLEMAGDHW